MTDWSMELILQQQENDFNAMHFLQQCIVNNVNNPILMLLLSGTNRNVDSS